MAHCPAKVLLGYLLFMQAQANKRLHTMPCAEMGKSKCIGGLSEERLAHTQESGIYVQEK